MNKGTEIHTSIAKYLSLSCQRRLLTNAMIANHGYIFTGRQIHLGAGGFDAVGVLIISPTAGGCNVDSEGGKYTEASSTLR